MSPEKLEKLRQAAATPSNPLAGADEDAVADFAAAALASADKDAAAFAAFSRTAGIPFESVVSKPEETAQAFSRELADAKAAASAMPKPPNAEVLHERRLRVNSAVEGLSAKGWPKAFTDRLKGLLTGTNERPNAVMLSRDANAEDVGAMEFVKLLSDTGGPPPATGAFAAGREAQRPEWGKQGEQTPEQLREEGRQLAEKLQKQQLERMGAK